MKIYTPNPRTNRAGYAISVIGSFLALVIIVWRLSIHGIDLKKPAPAGNYTDSLCIWHETNDGIQVTLVSETDLFEPILEHSEIPNPIEK
jgi:hypothetical protein